MRTSGAGSWWVRPVGLVVGMMLDRLLADPRRGHPVAGFGNAVSQLERAVYADARSRGVLFTAVTVAVPVAAATGAVAGARRLGAWSAPVECALTGLVTWAVLGGESLAREGEAMRAVLDRGDLDAARGRLRNLCARDPQGLSADELARATVESLAENTSDAVVAPLLWGAVAGLPGLVGYRAVNTLDAMVGYRSDRYRRFGWASARSDDVLNLPPARVAAVLGVLAAPVVGGSRERAARAWRRDGRRHPSPNAGQVEAAFAGALGVRLGGRNRYGDQVEARPELGEGAPPTVADLPRAVRLGRLVSWAALGVAVVTSGLLGVARGRWVVRPAGR